MREEFHRFILSTAPSKWGTEMAAPRTGSINDPAPGPAAGRPPDANANSDPGLVGAILSADGRRRTCQSVPSGNGRRKPPAECRSLAGYTANNRWKDRWQAACWRPELPRHHDGTRQDQGRSTLGPWGAARW